MFALRGRVHPPAQAVPREDLAALVSLGARRPSAESLKFRETLG